jgi:hypothetical protein
MKFFLTGILVLAFSNLALASDRPVAECERNDNDPHPYLEKFARIHLYSDYAIPLQAENRADLDSMREDSIPLDLAYKFMPRYSVGSRSVYADADLEEVKRRANAVQLFKLPKSVLRDVKRYQDQPFEVKFEDRDYDDDYSFLKRGFKGYVMRDEATYTCVLH